MVNDASWSPTTPFKEAIGPTAFLELSPFVMLRTCKSDTIAGLKTGLAEKVAEQDADWMVSGKYGMIQMFP